MRLYECSLCAAPLTGCRSARMIHHNDVSLRIDRNTERFAEIHVGIDLEEIRNRFKRDQWDIIHNRHILVWARLPHAGGRRTISALTASPTALRKDGKGSRKNRCHEEHS